MGANCGLYGGKNEQRKHVAVFAQQGRQQYGMVVLGIVQHDHHAFAARAVPQQLFQEGLERQGIELPAHGAHELAAGEAHCAKACHRLAGRRMEQYRILDLGRHPHPASCAVLLEMAFVQAPQFNVASLCQTPQFF